MSTAVAPKRRLFAGCLTMCKAAPTDGDAFESEPEESDDDTLGELPPGFFDQVPKGPRGSVSAEAYGQWNVKKLFNPPIHPKTDDQKRRIKEVLSQSFMFTSLDGEDLESVILAAEEVAIESGNRIINQGEDGNHLYIVEKGQLDCYKRFPDGEKKVKTCVPGDCFGELSLLYNTPRAASVEATEPCTLWRLDRETFNHIVKESASRKRVRYETFLRSVPVFNPLDAYELSQVADALKTESFTAGQTIVQQGEPGDQFYLIENGTCQAFKDEQEEAVKDYKVGDYFGELALLRDAPRAATVKATSDVDCLVIERRAFKRLLGSLEQIMARESKAYK
ncbi:hypothetical protein FOZ60_010463 [Perkinsus olseni]|uniref:cAMP-dependent protein kinase regulatory subunit n=1 Tax=Perkinsus olseni TaxID=32597 RepID=A0A7J6NGA5_PEROL|nr:hypothetical protein FOZ60_010463 [Perkinsus olseni]